MSIGRSLPQTRQRRFVGATLSFALLILPLYGCQHSQMVKDHAAREKAKAVGTTDNDGNTPGGPKSPFHIEGISPSEALLATETPLTTLPTTPGTDEENRTSCGDQPVADLYTPSQELQTKAAQIVSQMTIEQKVTQITGVEVNYKDGNRWEDIQRSRDDESLNLRGYQWRDGPHGLNLEAGQGRDSLENYSTSFPVSIAQGATFDVDLMYRMGEAMGDETVAAGNNVLLAPCMNLLRHPRWGRAQETFGEDTYHLGRMATGVTVGLQQYVTGCAKHWLANNIDTKRFSINAQMDEQTLREVYGRHFEMVVRDGGIGCVMASYNSVNGIKQTQNKHTLTEVLRDDFGFRGFVLTDWWSMPGANNGQGPVNAPADQINTRDALEAGLDVEVPWLVNFDAIPAIVGQGFDVKNVDRAVTRVLEQKLRFGTAYLDGPLAPKAPTVSYDAARGALTGTEGHADIAREVAEKGTVLLKNENATLPITSAQTVAVIGATVDYFVKTDQPSDKKFNFVVDAALGDRGSSRVRPDPALTVGPLAGITSEAPPGVTIVSGSDPALAASADIAVVIVGLTAGDEGEEYTGASDRENLNLPPPHDELVQQVIAQGKPTVVIVESGGIVNLPWLSQVQAAMMAWYPGQTGGKALGRLLFGKANFSGRLPVTWPTEESQFPPFDEGPTTHMDYYTGYRWFDIKNLTPLFAFGHGLSYSTFSYERLHVPCGDVTEDSLIQVEVDVRNTAGPAGDEVVMVFASYPQTKAPRRSEKELKGFARVHLEPGEVKRVSIPVRVQEFKYWDMASNRWIVEKGAVSLSVGPSSDKLGLSTNINVQ